MYLTKQQLENMGAAVLQNFRNATGIYTRFTPIDQLAKDYLGLNVKFAKLSDDGKVCGLTAYADTNYSVFVDGHENIYPVKANDIIMDIGFIDTPEHVYELCGKRRFTLAHECAHQILFGLESEEEKAKHRKMYSERQAYSCRDLKSREDWNEWQANALGAALLMPADSIQELMQNYRIMSYAGRLMKRDRDLVTDLSRLFSVSYSAMNIRLENLGYKIDQPMAKSVALQEVAYG